MEILSPYIRRKIAHHYVKFQSSWATIEKYSITYKQLYKVLETCRIASFKTLWWVLYKTCTSCKWILPYNDKYFYKRKWTEYFYSNCKKCMWLLAKNYKIINKKKLLNKNKDRARIYYYNNIEAIKNQKRNYYRRNKNKISKWKRLLYVRSKIKFLKVLKIFIK
jgi:hypothetical protein